MPLLRNGDARSNVISHPLPAAIGLDAAEHIEAGFKPVAESLGNLERLVHSVMGRLDTVDDLFAPIHCEIRMDFDHGGARRHQFRGIDLDLVVILRKHEGACEEEKDWQRGELADRHGFWPRP